MAQLQGLTFQFGTLLSDSGGISASLNVTLDAATLSSDATADQSLVGNLSVTLDGALLSAAGQFDNVASLSATLDAATLASTAQFGVAITADLSVLLDAATLSATGTLEIPVTEGFGVGGPDVYDVFPIIGIAELYNVRHRTH
jgi:hypothetical protein